MKKYDPSRDEEFTAYLSRAIARSTASKRRDELIAFLRRVADELEAGA